VIRRICRSRRTVTVGGSSVPTAAGLLRFPRSPREVIPSALRLLALQRRIRRSPSLAGADTDSHRHYGRELRQFTGTVTDTVSLCPRGWYSASRGLMSPPPLRYERSLHPLGSRRSYDIRAAESGSSNSTTSAVAVTAAIPHVEYRPPPSWGRSWSATDSLEIRSECDDSVTGQAPGCDHGCTGAYSTVGLLGNVQHNCSATSQNPVTINGVIVSVDT